MSLKGACIIGQSGGPTTVINASALGVMQTALKSDSITQVLGAAYGIKGVLKDQLYDIGLEDPEELDLLRQTPSSALGSCRYKLADPDKDDTDYKRILEVFKKHDVRYFFYNGGNDSMDTCNKISKYMNKVGYECRVMGIPKTIDNDLYGTDHCPGFASAAKYIAHVLHGSQRGRPRVRYRHDHHYGSDGPQCRLACRLLRPCLRRRHRAPDLIYLPEVPFDMEVFLNDVEKIYKQKGSAIVTVSEGIRDKDGKYISEYGASLARDNFGHAQMGGLASTLVGYVKEAHGRQNARHRIFTASALRRAHRLRHRRFRVLHGRTGRRRICHKGRDGQDGRF